MLESGPTFDDVLESHGDALWRLTAGYARQLADREDLYQEILLAVWKALPAFRGAASVRTFVFRIGHNRGLTFRGRAAARARRETDVSEALPDPEAGRDEAPDRVVDPERLAEAVGRLPPSLSQTVILSLEGLSYAEIAAVLEVTENNVGVRMHRARRALAEILSPERSP